MSVFHNTLFGQSHPIVTHGVSRAPPHHTSPAFSKSSWYIYTRSITDYSCWNNNYEISYSYLRLILYWLPIFCIFLETEWSVWKIESRFNNFFLTLTHIGFEEVGETHVLDNINLVLIWLVDIENREKY